MDFIAYQYNEEGYYVGETECQRDPRRNQPLIPRNATQVPPLEFKENELLRFDIMKQEWHIVEKIIVQSNDAIQESIKLLENPTKENIKKVIAELISIL